MKQSKYSRIAALLMVFVMVFTMIPPMAFAGTKAAAPFTTVVNGEEMTDISESTLTWSDWSGSTSDVTCYTVIIPEGAGEATLQFTEEMQWSYYDSTGNYVGAGDTSWTASTEHTVAIADSNGDSELDGISVQYANEYTTAYYIMFKYAAGEENVSAPFTAIVNGEEMTDISESTLTWTDWSGSTSDVTCYTIIVPEGAGEATLQFAEEMQWSYYDSHGNYVGAGDSSWTASTEHTVAIVDSNSDGELDGISMQIPNDYSTAYFILFKYAVTEGEHVHSYDAGEVTTPATCVAEGEKTFRCTSCDEGTEGHSYTEPIAVTGHSYDAGVIEPQPTCSSEGVKTFTCQNEWCTAETEGHIKTESVSKVAHSYDEGVIDPAPTCTEEGVKTFTCISCTADTVGHTKTESVPATGHQRGDDTECDICGDIAPVQDEDGVYQIGTAKELIWFAEEVNRGNASIDGALIADIELDADWPGIGVYGNAYAGAFDGQKHKVTLNNSTWGVFGYVMGTHNNHALKDAAVIENIIVEGTVKNSALIHTAGYARITNCINKAEITSENSKVAGIVGSVSGSNKYGQIYSDVMIQNCANEGNIKGDNNIGGILGYSQAKATLDGCYNTGSVEGSSNVGGLVGYMQGSTGKGVIQNSFNKGTITGTSCVAGIIGNMYNGVSITNCYNAGEATYAIAGNIYNNTASITNTYYRGNLCTYSVPDVTQNAGYYSGNRGIAMTSAEMSSEELAALLGDVFKQSCPSPVLSYQETSDHVIENNVCQICKQGNDMPEEFAVTFAAVTGSEIVGDTTFRKGNSYTFSVNVLAGYYATEDFAVYVNGTKVEAVDGLYTVSEPDGPFYISTSGVKEEEGILPIVLPGAGEGYRVNSCDGYGATVERGKDYKFTVSFVEGFAAGEDFLVKANGLIVKADENGVYTLENITLQQNITVEGVDVVPSGNTVAVKVDFTKGDYTFLASEETDTIMMDKTLEIPYFDIALYDLEKYYYNPYCYLDENGNIRGQQKAGTRESAYDVVTSMHAFIYMTEVYYLGYDPEDAGKGLSCLEDTDDDGISDFDEAVSWTQNVGSTFMNLWGQGTNLNYHVNYEYPIAYPGWGSTSDQQALVDGDLVVIHLITGSASGSAFGVFVVNDNNNTYDRTDERDEATVKQGESITLTHYLGTQGDHYTTNFVKVTNKSLDWIEEGNETADIRDWNTDTGFGTIAEENFKTDENGQITIDTTGVEPGVYYIGAAGGFEKGSGVAGSDGFVSSGSEAGPSYFKLTVEEADNHVEADALAEAKAAAKKTVAEYKNASDYRDAQKAELTAAIEAANKAIDGAESVEAVEQAVANAKTAMDSIKTDAQLKAEEEAAKAEAAAKALAEAKEVAKKDIAGYKDAADYRDAQKAELTAAIEAANKAIDAAESVGAVEQAVANAKTAMDSIKTDAQLKAEEEANKPETDEPTDEPVDTPEANEPTDKPADTPETDEPVATVKLKTPSNVKATNVAKTGKIKLTWTKVAGAEKYKIYRATSKNGKYTYMNTVTGTSYINKTAKAGKTYFYKVKAVSGDKNVTDSAFSKIVKRTCDLARPIVKASNVAKTGKVKLTWTKVAGAEKYKIYRATSKNGKYTYMNTVTGTSYINKTAKAGTPYYYKVKAIDADNSAANSAFSTVDKRTCDLARPDVTVKSKTKKQIKLTWKKVVNAKKYVVYRATSKNGKYTKIATTTKLSFTNKKLKSGKTYYYKVKAISKNSAANSAFSTIDKCKVK